MVTQKKQTSAQNVLAEAHHDFEKSLNDHAFFKLNDHAMSDDLVQDTFRKTWTYMLRGGKIELMRAFLYHILNGLIIDQYRKKHTVSLDVMIEHGFDPGLDPTARLIDAIDGRKAIQLIEQLPVKYRSIILMRYVQMLTLKEISENTDQSINTVTVQSFRGLEKLKSLYLKKLEVGGYREEVESIHDEGESVSAELGYEHGKAHGNTIDNV